MWSAAGEQKRIFHGHTAPVTSVAFSRNGQCIASGSLDRTILVWFFSGERVRILNGHTDWIRSVAFSPDGQHIVSGSGDQTVRVWSVFGQVVHSRDGHVHLFTVIYPPVHFAFFLTVGKVPLGTQYAEPGA
jgi:WD40 repeat protein